MNVGTLSLENIQRFGEYDMVSYKDKTYTNVDLFRRAGQIAEVLRYYGVKPGENVLIMMPNSPDVLACFQAVWRLGAVIMPVTPMLTAREVHFLLENSEAAVAITTPELAARLMEAADGVETFQELLVLGHTDVPEAHDISPEIDTATPIDDFVDRDPDDMAMLLYTSGTTGNPKGVMLTHQNLQTNHLAVAALQNVEPQCRTLVTLPLSHSFGVLVMDTGYILGTCVKILPKFDPEEVLRAIDEFKVERMSVVPTMLTYLLNHPNRDRYDYSSLVRIGSGGAALPDELRKQFEAKFNCLVKQGYGLSETSPTLTSYEEDDPYRPGSVGHSLEGVTVAILDDAGNVLPSGQVGEICAQGPNVMKGYWKLPEVTAEAMKGGWFHSGDVGYLDADGYLVITDRKKELIIKGGENISPREIEEALHKHPAVAEAAVLSIPDDTFGENIAAALKLKPDAAVTEDELRKHLLEYITKFKLPAKFLFMEDLPKNPTGKIQKREIRKQFDQSAPATKK